MRHERIRRMGWALLTAWLVLPGIAAAQEATIPAGEQAPLAEEDSGERSMLEIIRDGIEWPTYFIFAGSAAAIALVADHFISIRRATVVPAGEVKRARELIENRQFRECLDQVKQSQTFFARVMAASLQHARHGFDAMHEAALEKSGELSGGMFRRVEYLNVLGNLGPLLGLLGTVLGMIHAFGAMGASGGAGGGEATALSVGISQALVNTMLGLALAIIGLGFFGPCRNRVDGLTTQATVDVLDLLEFFRPAPAKRQSSSASASQSAS